MLNLCQAWDIIKYMSLHSLWKSCRNILQPKQASQNKNKKKIFFTGRLIIQKNIPSRLSFILLFIISSIEKQSFPFLTTPHSFVKTNAFSVPLTLLSSEAHRFIKENCYDQTSMFSFFLFISVEKFPNRVLYIVLLWIKYAVCSLAFLKKRKFLWDIFYYLP